MSGECGGCISESSILGILSSGQFSRIDPFVNDAGRCVYGDPEALIEDQMRSRSEYLPSEQNGASFLWFGRSVPSIYKRNEPELHTH